MFPFEFLPRNTEFLKYALFLPVNIEACDAERLNIDSKYFAINVTSPTIRSQSEVCASDKNTTMGFRITSTMDFGKSFNLKQ